MHTGTCQRDTWVRALRALESVAATWEGICYHAFSNDEFVSFLQNYKDFVWSLNWQYLACKMEIYALSKANYGIIYKQKIPFQMTIISSLKGTQSFNSVTWKKFIWSYLFIKNSCHIPSKKILINNNPLLISIYILQLSRRSSIVSGLISKPPGVVGGTPRAQKNRNKKGAIGYVLIWLKL